MFYVFDSVDDVVVNQLFVLDIYVMIVVICQQQIDSVSVYMGSQNMVVRYWRIIVLDVVQYSCVGFMIGFFFDEMCQFVNIIYMFGNCYDCVFFIFCDICFDFVYQVFMVEFNFWNYNEFIVIGNGCS